MPPEKSASELLKAHKSRETMSSDSTKVKRRADSGQLFAPDCRLGSDGQVQPCSGWNGSMDKEVVVTQTGGKGKGASLEQPRNFLSGEKTTDTYARSIGDMPDLGANLPAVRTNAASPGKEPHDYSMAGIIFE